MDDLEEYGSIFFRYFPEEGSYHLYENLLGLELGSLQLNEGPGWILNVDVRRSGLMYDELGSIVEMIGDLNAEIEQEELVELFSFGKLEPVKTISVKRRQGFDE